MKLLFLGYAISLDEAHSIIGPSVAGNKMQINVLKNLYNKNNLEVISITLYPIAPYPITRNIYIKKEIINLFDNFYSLKISFLNFPIIKQFIATWSIYFAAKKIIKREHIKTIFTFNMFPQIGLPARWLKKKYGCEIITLLADLPIDDTIGRKGISFLLRKYFDKLAQESIMYCDKVIALNKSAVEIFAPSSDFIIVEGGIDPTEMYDISNKKFQIKNILYSGALVEYSGIINLIEAMRFVKDSEVVLDIYGRGQLEEYVKQCSENMKNVNYYGSVDSETIKKMQYEAYLLVNPRPVYDPISIVTFPSKIFEYMISGTPILTTRLNCFTPEYFDKMFFVETNEPKELSEMINYIMSLPIDKLQNIALLAKQFVLREKTWDIQGKRIYEFITKANNGTGKTYANSCADFLAKK